MKERASTSRATLVLLVTVAAFVNYIDRGNLATAAPLMQDQLHLSATQLGILSSAFYYGYVLAMAPLGCQRASNIDQRPASKIDQAARVVSGV
jgi:sugar phosphate permease